MSLSPIFAIKKAIRYRYDVSAVLLQGRAADAGSASRVAAHAVETVVPAALTQAGTRCAAGR